MTLAELQVAFEQRDLRGVSVTCWDTQTPTWTAVTRGEVVAGNTLSEAVMKLLDRFPVIQKVAP